MARSRVLALFVGLVLISRSAAAADPTAADPSAAVPAPAVQTAAAPTPTSPLAIHVGDADLLIGGFMDMTSISRSTDTGNGLGTNFSSFPFTTTATGALNPTGNLPETRFSAQNSRLTLQATSKVGGASVKGYLESDFLGNTAQNLNVTSNADTLRLRLYWVQFTSGKFEFLGGQSWSMLVPNRNGISPTPGDLFYSQDVDTNYQMGLTWTRNPQFRFVYHASGTATAGLSIENPQQYTGGAVALPSAIHRRGSRHRIGRQFHRLVEPGAEHLPGHHRQDRARSEDRQDTPAHRRGRDHVGVQDVQRRDGHHIHEDGHRRIDQSRPRTDQNDPSHRHELLHEG